MSFRKMASVIFFEAVEILIVEKFYKTQIKLPGKQILGIWYFKKEEKIRTKNQEEKIKKKSEKIRRENQNKEIYYEKNNFGRAKVSRLFVLLW